MQAGRIEQLGTPLELFDRPTNEFVATFIGAPSMNLLGGTVADGAVDLAGHKVPVDIEIADGTAVRLGIRPEHLRLAEPGEGLPMEVKVVEPTGSETMVFLRFEGQDITAVFRERRAFEAGEIIHLQPDPEHLHCFNADTGQRMASA